MKLSVDDASIPVSVNPSSSVGVDVAAVDVARKGCKLLLLLKRRKQSVACKVLYTDVLYHKAAVFTRFLRFLNERSSTTFKQRRKIGFQPISSTSLIRGRLSEDKIDYNFARAAPIAPLAKSTKQLEETKTE